jgi:hypothetical protein
MRAGPTTTGSGPNEADNRRDHEIGEDVLGAKLPIAGIQLGEYDRGDDCCNTAKFYGELDGWQRWQ